MSKRPGFTLLELLVVVAIIIILVAMLLPALLAAREKAYQAKCLYNQRDIAMAVHIWVMDHEQHYPSMENVWGELNLPPEKLRCPTREAEILLGQQSGATATSAIDYAYSGFLSGLATNTVSNPSDELLTADALPAAARAPEAASSPDNVFTLPTDFDFRHSDGFIGSFCDGHVALLHELPPYWLVNMENLAELDSEVLRYATTPVILCYSAQQDLILAPRSDGQTADPSFLVLQRFHLS